MFKLTQIFKIKAYADAEISSIRDLLVAIVSFLVIFWCNEVQENRKLFPYHQHKLSTGPLGFYRDCLDKALVEGNSSGIH